MTMCQEAVSAPVNTALLQHHLQELGTWEIHRYSFLQQVLQVVVAALAGVAVLLLVVLASFL
jgi:hypothetical protein